MDYYSHMSALTGSDYFSIFGFFASILFFGIYYYESKTGKSWFLWKKVYRDKKSHSLYWIQHSINMIMAFFFLGIGIVFLFFPPWSF